MIFSENHLIPFNNHLVAITDDGFRFSYAELQGWNKELYEQVGHRCLVFNLCTNSIESLVGYTTFIGNGIVPLLLDAGLDKELLDELILRYQPEYLWIPESRSSEFSNNSCIYEFKGYQLLKTSFNSNFQLYNELALLFATSGSTGSPKLVRISYRNLEANAQSIAEYLNITSHERPITALPMNYSFGLSIINSHLLKGATLLLTNRSLMEKEFWTLIKNEKATSFSGVPYTFEMLHKLRFFRMDLPYLRTLTQAGGKLNLHLTQEFANYCQQSGKRFFVMYGQTEATARMSYLPSDWSVTKAGSMGIAIPGGEFHLIDENQNIIWEPNTVGELVYKGSNVSLGYAMERTDLLKGDENQGVLFTGDLATRDEDGCYYIVGRKKRFIKLFGNRVNLDETEQILKTLIHDCACVGVDDQMIIYITDEARMKETQDYIALKTGIHHKAFKVRCIDKIPKNTSGKTIYSNLETV
ncbi:MAG: AMP-binding protein [Salinivirgaceae bacterium]|nr:AMP-binding protein [Salinivirgaceae bacterium]